MHGQNKFGVIDVNKEEFSKVIICAKENNEQCISDLLEACKPVLFKEVKKFCRTHKKIEFDDLYSVALMGFWDALKTYSPQNPSFLHYMKGIVHGRLINEVKKYFTQKRNINMEFSVPYLAVVCDVDLEDDLEGEEFKKDIKEIISNNLSELEFKVYNLFFNNISPVQISNMLNIDIKAIYNAIYRSENKIVTKYKEMKEI